MRQSFLRILASAWLIVAIVPAAAIAQQSGPATELADKPLMVDSPVDDILDALDVCGQKLHDFTADVKLAQTVLALGSTTTREGSIMFQKPPDGNARVKVEFTQRTVGKRPATKEQTEFLLADGWLTTRHYQDTPPMQVRQQVLRPGEKIDLLKLGEGPFPLPIGQSKTSVYKEFDVKKIPPAQNDPQGVQTVHLQLTTKPDTALARKFKTIDVWTDLTLKMPVRIKTLDVNEAETNTTDLTHIQLNGGLQAKDFALPPIGQDWNQTDEPFKD